MTINDMIQQERDNHANFVKELEGLINKYSMENIWDMPDFLMAETIKSKA